MLAPVTLTFLSPCDCNCPSCLLNGKKNSAWEIKLLLSNFILQWPFFLKIITGKETSNFRQLRAGIEETQQIVEGKVISNFIFFLNFRFGMIMWVCVSFKIQFIIFSSEFFILFWTLDQNEALPNFVIIGPFFLCMCLCGDYRGCTGDEWVIN